MENKPICARIQVGPFVGQGQGKGKFLELLEEISKSPSPLEVETKEHLFGVDKGIDRQAIVNRIAENVYGRWQNQSKEYREPRLTRVVKVLDAAGFWGLLEAADAVLDLPVETPIQPKRYRVIGELYDAVRRARGLPRIPSYQGDCPKHP